MSNDVQHRMETWKTQQWGEQRRERLRVGECVACIFCSRTEWVQVCHRAKYYLSRSQQTLLTVICSPVTACIIMDVHSQKGSSAPQKAHRTFFWISDAFIDAGLQTVSLHFNSGLMAFDM
jgi:hypothetical protein